MGFFSRFQKQLNMEDPKQLRKECGWLWSRVKKHYGAVLAVGALALLGTVMSLASSLASKYLIDAVTGFGTDRIGGAALWMVAMMLGGLLLQAVSSRVGARVHVRVRNRLQYKIYAANRHLPYNSYRVHRKVDISLFAERQKISRLHSKHISSPKETYRFLRKQKPSASGTRRRLRIPQNAVR